MQLFDFQGFLPRLVFSAALGVFTKRYRVRLKRNATTEPVCAW